MSCIKCHAVEIPNSSPSLCPECFMARSSCAFKASINELMKTNDEAIIAITLTDTKFICNVEGIDFATELNQNEKNTTGGIIDRKINRDMQREWNVV
jgi:hypothetical protein